MRRDYPISSLELNDKLLLSYEKLVYLLGCQIDDSEMYSGLYQYIEASGEFMINNPSGIPDISFNEIHGGLTQDSSYDKFKSILKYDYIYRKIYNQF